MLFKLKVIENLATLHQKYGEKQFEGIAFQDCIFLRFTKNRF